MKNRQLLLLAALGAALLILASATALAATPDSEQSPVPAWVAPEDAADFLEGYLEDAEAVHRAEDSGSATQATTNDPGPPMLLFVAPEDREEAVARTMKGEDVPLAPGSAGFQVIVR